MAILENKMGISSGVAAGAYGAQAISNLGTTFAQSQILEAQGDYSNRMAEINAKAAEFEAQDALKRGDEAANAQRRRTRQLLGEQRVALAGQGISTTSGTALALQEETQAVGETEALTIKNNAWREAWGLKSEAEASRAKGRFARTSSRFQSRNNLLTGVIESATSGIKAGYYGSKG